MSGGSKSPKITKLCKQCRTEFLTTVKREWRTHYCSKVCLDEWTKADRESRKQARLRECVTCGEAFYPRWMQIRATGALYCSNRCSTLPRLKAMSAKGLAERNRRLSEGIIKLPVGLANKQWKGGPKAAISRAIADGRAAEWNRRYRANNPEKTREWKKTRSGRVIGRLPRGTIPALYEKQRGKCSVCHVSLGKSYHADHITPLASGGEHAPNNLQLLCQHCNCTKSAKDPIKFMQERGFLL